MNGHLLRWLTKEVLTRTICSCEVMNLFELIGLVQYDQQLVIHPA